MKRLILPLLVLALAVALPAQPITSSSILSAFHLSSGHMVSNTLTPLATGGVRVEFDVDADHYTLDVQPYSVRSPLYKVWSDTGRGLVEVPAAPECTYRGVLVGEPGVVVAASLLPTGVFARIQWPNGTIHWLQPMSDQVPTAPATMGVFYANTDVLPTNNTACIELPSETGQQQGVSIASTDNDVCELACDADWEYYDDYGRSTTNVQNRINTVINAMNSQYESEVNITHQITAIVIRTNKRNSYKGKNASSLLTKFRQKWIADHGNIQRDVAHYFSGKSLSGNTIGIAWLSAVCSSYGYGLVESDFNGNFGCTTDLSAHELGHNWGAGHCSCAGGGGYTMNSYITCANTFHPSLTIPVINSFKASIGCLN